MNDAYFPCYTSNDFGDTVLIIFRSSGQCYLDKEFNGTEKNYILF